MAAVLVFPAKAYSWIRLKRIWAFSAWVLFDLSRSSLFLVSIVRSWKAGFSQIFGLSVAMIPVVHWLVSKLGQPCDESFGPFRRAIGAVRG